PQVLTKSLGICRGFFLRASRLRRRGHISSARPLPVILLSHIEFSVMAPTKIVMELRRDY
ncbi:hypothetical protein, partial [Stutzerimonas stutzeri]|uniref:hypothetical protein n=1 Tax=Stutzerimonas stutzeri TaxID=316 RepID=UPI001F1E7261